MIKILVVDDDPYLLDLLMETLKAIGYDAVGAASGDEALDLVEKNEIHLVITDIKMPGMNGMELAQLLKGRFPKLPIIFITGVFSPDVLQGQKVDGILAKPFRINQIEELIKQAISERSDYPTDNQKILVVDDDDGFRLMLNETLKLSGYDVISVSDSKKAIDLLEEEDFSIIITDYKIPGMDGFSLAKYIKSIRPEIPVVMITAYLFDQPDPAVEAYIDGFLMKPFKIESITEVLENLKGSSKSLS